VRRLLGQIALAAFAGLIGGYVSRLGERLADRTADKLNNCEDKVIHVVVPPGVEVIQHEQEDM
jgi:hypothetical protein